MANDWENNPKIMAAKDFAKQFNKKIVIIIGIDNINIEASSYGIDKVHCERGKKLADVAYDAIMRELIDEAIPLRVVQDISTMET